MYGYIMRSMKARAICITIVDHFEIILAGLLAFQSKSLQKST